MIKSGLQVAQDSIDPLMLQRLMNKIEQQEEFDKTILERLARLEKHQNRRWALMASDLNILKLDANGLLQHTQETLETYPHAQNSARGRAANIVKTT